MKAYNFEKEVEKATRNLNGTVRNTPLQFSKRLSSLYNSNVYIKREDLQDVRSYKIRGAYNKLQSLTFQEKKRGVVAASAGNHAQGVAFSANKLRIKATIFMPTTTPLQKIQRVEVFGGNFVKIKIAGDNYDAACKEALLFCKKTKAVFVHPFDDMTVIAGQGTVAKEIYDKLGEDINFIICPIGGGGFISGISLYFSSKLPKVTILGAEPLGSPSMYESVKRKKIINLPKVDTFVDGAAVKMPGKLTFNIVKRMVKKIFLIPEGKICETMIDIYQNEGIVAEPAGALSIAALDLVKDKIRGKTVVCVLSGGNNDILRYPEIMERSLIYQGRKHYFLIEFAQKPGQLRKLVDKALGPTDDIVRFEYIKKTSKETGPALVGIELTKKEDFWPLIKRLKSNQINFTIIKPTDLLYSYLV